MNFKKMIKSMLVLVLVITLAACSNGTNPPKGDQTPTADDKPTYKIGLHYELTGDVADYGVAENKGSKLAIKLANEKAGYEKFVGLEYDNKSEVGESVILATKLAGEGVIGVVGPATSGASAASYQILNDAQVVVISPSATQNNVTLKNPDNPQSAVYDYVFRVCFEDSYQGAAMAQYTKDTLAAKKVVIYGDSASDYSKGLIEAFTNQFTKLGGEIVETAYYTAKDTDFSAVLTNISNMEFDALFIAGYYSEAGLIIKQAREMGIDKAIVGADGFDSQSLIELAGAANLNNVYFTTAYTAVDASDMLQTFIDAYKAEYEEDPAMFAALAFDATNLLMDSVEKAGNNPVELQKVIREVNFKGVTGNFSFDDTHTPIKSVLVVKLVDGVQSSAESVSPQ